MLKIMMRGEYHRNLKRWFTLFGRRRFFILSSDMVRRDCGWALFGVRAAEMRARREMRARMAAARE
jgi:hypothetical protein